MAGGLFYNLGKKVGPKFRKARWVWESMAGSEADAMRLEYSVGADLAEEARTQLQLDPDPQARRLLDDVGCRLARRVKNPLRSFHFDTILSDQPNAFALPGGFIFIGRALVELCQWDPHEMAFVLAHEMGHVVSGHAIERIITGSAVSMASRVAPVRGVLGGWLRNVGVRFLETAYSRDQELDADRLGVRLAAAAEYRPEAAIRLLSRLAELGTGPDALDLGEYFSTHPAFDVRIRSVRQFLQRRAAVDTQTGA